MEEPVKTFYVLKDVDKFRAGQIVQMTRTEAADHVNGGFFILWHIAIRDGLVGKTPPAPVKVPEVPKKDFKETLKNRKKR